MKMQLPGRLAQVSNVHMRKRLEKLSDLISQKFEQQLDESAMGTCAHKDFLPHTVTL